MVGRAIMSGTRAFYLPVLLSILLLGGIAADRLLYRQPAGDAGPYHAKIKSIMEEFPTRIGDWFGQRVDPPKEAVELLKPNLIISRRYENVLSGKTVSFLIVHCSDSSDLTGHYPPNCYPSQGWETASAEPQVWDLGMDRPVRGMAYRFEKPRFAGRVGIVIYNFMILPTGEMVGDMDSLYSVASDPRIKHYGAGQIQFISDDSLDDAERWAVFREFMKASRPIIDAIRSGAGQ